MKPVVKVIELVLKCSNEELISLLKEISPENKSDVLSSNADKLFKFYNNDNWQIGLDRFDEIIRILEFETIKRIKENKILGPVV